MLLLGYGYKRNNLARLGGYPAHQNVADMSDFFYFDFVFIWLRRRVGGGDGGGRVTVLLRSKLLKPSGMNKNQCKNTSAGLVSRKLCELCLCTNSISQYKF